MILFHSSVMVFEKSMILSGTPESGKSTRICALVRAMEKVGQTYLVIQSRYLENDYPVAKSWQDVIVCFDVVRGEDLLNILYKYSPLGHRLLLGTSLLGPGTSLDNLSKDCESLNETVHSALCKNGVTVVYCAKQAENGTNYEKDAEIWAKDWISLEIINDSSRLQIEIENSQENCEKK